MKISMDKEYVTVGGLEVKLYSVEGNTDKLVHGATNSINGWDCCMWTEDGVNGYGHLCLQEKSIMDVTDIPWDALKDDIVWVAMDRSYSWFGYVAIPHCCGGFWEEDGSVAFELDAVHMPEVDDSKWQDTLVKRPES